MACRRVNRIERRCLPRAGFAFPRRLLQMRHECLFQGLRAPLLHDIRRRVSDQHPACMHQRDAVAALGLVHEVGGDEDGHAVAARQLDQLAPEGVARHRVDARGGLVEDQHLGLVDHGHRQRQTLAVAEGQLAWQTVHHGGQIEAFNHFVHPP